MTAIVCNFQRKTVYQCCAEQINFIDYLRSCCALYEICKERVWDVGIDFSSHAVFASLFCCKIPKRNGLTIFKATNREQVITLVGDSDDLQININAELIPQNRILTAECREFLLENFLTLQPDFQEYFNEQIATLGLEQKRYNVIYIHSADSLSHFSKGDSTVLICRDRQLQEKVANEFGYIQWADKGDDVRNEVLLFLLFANACKVTSMGATPEVALWACEIFGTELDEANFAEFTYGIDSARTNCTVKSKRQFVTHGQILIKRKEIFNDLFGDVAQNREKTLRITFDDNVSIAFPEHRQRAYAITQSYDT